MIKRIWNWLASWFKSSNNFTLEKSLSNTEFNEMKKFFENSDNKIEITRISETEYEIWKSIPAIDELGNFVSAAENIALYNSKSETLHFAHEFINLFYEYSKYHC